MCKRASAPGLRRPVRWAVTWSTSVVRAEILAETIVETSAVIPPHVQRNDPLESRLCSGPSSPEPTPVASRFAARRPSDPWPAEREQGCATTGDCNRLTSGLPRDVTVSAEQAVSETYQQRSPR